MKRLLTSLLATVALVASSAQDVGDYIYTRTGKVKIVNASNLVSNGDFKQGLEGWSTEDGGALSSDYFTLAQSAPDGGIALVTLQNEKGPATGSDFHQRVAVDEGVTYYVSYRTYTETTKTSTTTYGDAKNYQNVYFNVSGQLLDSDGQPDVEEPVARPLKSPAGDWAQATYSFTAPASGYLFIHCYAPYTGQQFADFKVLEAKAVPDDREVNKLLAKIDEYLANPLFPNGHDLMEMMKEELAKAVESEDKASADQLISLFDTELLPRFLDENSLNVSDRLDMCDFDNATVSNNSVNSVGKWKVTYDGSKSRWQVSAPSTVSGSPLTTTHLRRSTPASAELSASSVAQTVNLPAGKYMFTMQVNACRYTDKTNTTKVDSTGIRGLYVFMGKDTVECLDVDTFKMNRYTVFTSLEEPADVTLGFYMGTPTCHELRLDLTELRAFGTTQEEFEAYFNAKEFATARESLAAQLVTARQLYASADFIFGKPALLDSIEKSQALYDRLTEVATASTDSLNNQAKRLGRAITAFQTLNAEYVSLGEAIKEGETIMADESVTSGKDALAEVLAAGKAYYQGITAESERDSATLAFHADAIRDAIVAVKAAQLSADEMYRFYEWASVSGADYASSLATEPLEVSAGSTWTTMRQETATFGGHDLAGRFGFNTVCTQCLEAEAGLKISSPKNKLILSLQNLKTGNEVTIDWLLSAGSLYVASGNAVCTLDDGTERVFTKTGNEKAVKVSDNIVNTKNTEGLNGTHRTRFVMTADGTLDFFVGSTTNLTLAYVAINEKAKPTAIDETISNGNTSEAKVRKFTRKGKLYIQTPRGTFNATGVRIR